MLNTRIDRAGWGAFLDRLTRGHAAVPGQATARVRVVRPDEFEGTRGEAWLPFIGVTWEPKADTLTVALDGLDHRIAHPISVWADEAPGGHVQALVVLGERGRRDEVAFRMAGLQAAAGDSRGRAAGRGRHEGVTAE